MPRKTHPSKEIEAVLRGLEAGGWTIVNGKGHAWGVLRCPTNSPECRGGEFCQMSVWSTPKNPENFAKKLKQKALGCIRPVEKEAQDG